jgi:membrane-bound lytic murein transglycosylase A
MLQLPGAAAAVVPVSEGARPLLLDDGDVPSLQEAIGQSLTWLARQPSGQRILFGSRAYTIAEQRELLRRMLRLLAGTPSPELLHQRVLAEFDLVKSIGREDGAVLVTGYHEPIIEAAAAPSAEYRVPIFGVPPNLPEPGRGRYWTRAEIEQGRLDNLVRPLAWARDPVDVFFMEIEGSGTLRLSDGRELRVGYAATNGHPYRSIGRLLIEEGRISREAMTMRALRDWLSANPRELERVLRHNEAYVFFRLRPGSPVGSLGVTLTPGRSIATDPRVFPRAALAFVRTIRPTLAPDGSVVWRSIARFVLNQDAGGAIRGPGRLDIFWGRGPEADLAASEMKEPGELFFVVPKAPEGNHQSVCVRPRAQRCTSPPQLGLHSAPIGMGTYQRMLPSAQTSAISRSSRPGRPSLRRIVPPAAERQTRFM